MKKIVAEWVKLSAVNFVLAEPLSLEKPEPEMPDSSAGLAKGLLAAKRTPFVSLTLWSLPS
jgi:hypothetical protein